MAVAEKLRRSGALVSLLLAVAATPLVASDGPRNASVAAVLAEVEALQADGWPSRAAAQLKRLIDSPGLMAEPATAALVLGRQSDIELQWRRSRQALELADRALEAAARSDDPAIQAAALNHRGNALAALQRAEEADLAYARGLRIAPRSEPELRRQIAINRIHLQIAVGSAVLASDPLRELLDELRDDPQARLEQLASAAYLAARLADAGGPGADRIAYEWLTRVDRLAQAAGRARLVSEMRGALARLYRTAGRATDARAWYGQALFHAESADAPELAARWQAALARSYADQGLLDAAEQAYASALARLEAIRGALVYGWRGNPHAFRDGIQPIYRDYVELLLTRAESAVDAVGRQAGLRRIREILESLRRIELQDHFGDQCVDRRYAGAGSIELAEVLVPGVASVYPMLFGQRVVSLVGLADGRLEIFSSAVPAEQLEAALSEFRERLATPGNPRRLRRVAQRLYGWLFEPLRATLERSAVHTLVVVPDGLLRAIPYAGLFDGQRFLAEGFAFPLTPGLDLALGQARPSARLQGRALLNGLSEPVQDFEALPGVLEELAGIARDTRHVLLTNESFRFPRVQSEMSSADFDAVVFATHARFTSDPRDSFLLTYDDRISLDTLEQLLSGGTGGSSRRIDLLVLSACETAQGDERAALGLAGAAVKAGVNSVLASLWSVQDRSAAVLVPRFFELRQARPELSKAQALRQAQAELIDDPRYSHPYFWAPFVLIGDWR